MSVFTAKKKVFICRLVFIILATNLTLVVILMSRRSEEGRDYGIRFKGAWARFRDEKKRNFFAPTRNCITVK
jgi:hypothetical protein